MSLKAALTLRSRPLPSVAGRCAIKRRAAPLTYNVSPMPYIDDYSACARTYATFRLYPGEASPSVVTRALGLVPTSVSVQGEKSPRHVNGWFLSSQGVIESRDSRRHIDWLLDQVEPVAAELDALVLSGAKADISCFWESSSGNGGPMLSPEQMKRLCRLHLSVGWDVWFSSNP